MKKILIDANPIVPILSRGHYTGIGNTCLNLILALDKIKNELPFEIDLFTQNIQGVSSKILNTSFKTYHSFLRNTTFFNKLSYYLHLRELITRYDLQHITHNHEYDANPSKTVVTVHDAFFMKLNDNTFDYENMRNSYPHFIKNCHHIITCSEYSKNDIVNFIAVSPEKITVIPWGIDHSTFFPERDKMHISLRLKEEFNIIRPYFLSVSCDAGRKRTPELINAWLALDDKRNDLVLVWNNPPEDIQTIVNKNNRIHLFSKLSNSSLRLLYNGATSAINPTSYEGFGLPILEAMSCGCPIVTCNNSSLPEVGGEVAIYIEEPIKYNLPVILNLIDKQGIDLISRRIDGVKRAELFTWEKTARSTAQVYENALS